MDHAPRSPLGQLDLVDSLRAAMTADGLDLSEGPTVAIPVRKEQNLPPKQEVPICDGEKVASWTAPLLRELFRGNRVPPSLDRYPEAYIPFFGFIEEHVLAMFEELGERTDQQMEEIYAALRRRPDGRSLGREHDFLWQSCAAMLGSHVLSAAEFEAIINRLERSARTFSMRPVSRNYAAYLKQQLRE